MVSIAERLRRVFSAARNGSEPDTPAPPLTHAAPLSKDTQQLISLLMGDTISNPDPLMSQQRPTNRAYLAGFGLYEEVLDNDTAVYGNVKQRQLEVLASPRALNPADESDEAQRYHAFIEHWQDHELSGLEDTLGEIWMAIWYGVSYLEADYQLRDVEFEAGQSTQRLTEAVVIDRFWSRRRGRFIFDTDYLPRLLTAGNLTTGERLPARKILHPAPRKRYENPYGEPLARVIFRWHYMKKHAAKWKIVDLERWGSPFVHFRRPAGATQAQLDAFDSVLKAFQTGFGCHYPDDIELNLENIFHASTAASPHEAWADFCDKQAAIAILGQTLTSQQGDKGTQALGTVHKQVLDKVAQADANALSEAWNVAIRWMIELNFGASAARLAPQLSIDASKRDVKAYLEAVEKAQKVGLPVSRSQSYDETAFEIPDDDDVLEPPRAPTPQGLFSLPAPDKDDDDKPKDENKSQRQPAGKLELRFAAPTAGAHAALNLPPGPIRSTRPGGFKGAETKRARLAAELVDQLPQQGELTQLYEDGVAAQAATLGEIPDLVAAWVREQYAARGLGPDDPISPDNPQSDPTTLPWAELELPAEMKDAFVDRLNDDHTIAQLLAREAVLKAADALGIEAVRAALDDPLENPLVEALWGHTRLIPRRVMSIHTRRVHQSLEYDDFYKLDALARAQSFTAWDLVESDVRHIGGAMQDAINWGYTVQQFEDYLIERLRPRYVMQGTEMHAWHIQTIHHINLSVATNTAQADEAHDLADSFPYVMFVNPDPQAPPCVERAGRIWRSDSEFLRSSTPPLHFGCASSLELLTEQGAQQEGLTPELAMPTVSPEVYAGPKDPATGEPVGDPQPFGAWAPLSERYQHLEQELQRVRSES